MSPAASAVQENCCEAPETFGLSNLRRGEQIMPEYSFLFLGWTNPLNPVKNTEGMNLGVLSGSSCPAGAQRDNLSNLVFVGLRGPKKFNRSASEWNKTERAGKCFAFFGPRNDSSDESVFECLCLKPFDNAAIWDSLIQPCIKCLTQSQPADWESKQTPLLPQCKSRHPGS